MLRKNRLITTTFLASCLLVGTPAFAQYGNYSLVEPTTGNVVQMSIYDQTTALTEDKNYEVKINTTIGSGGFEDNINNIDINFGYYNIKWKYNKDTNPLIYRNETMAIHKDSTEFPSALVGVTIHNANGTDPIAAMGPTTAGALHLYSKAHITEITNSNFVNNSNAHIETAQGGAIYNMNGSIDVIKNTTFINNSANTYGGAIANDKGMTIGDISGVFIGNYTTNDVGRGGAIFNDTDAKIGNISADFIGNYAPERGGAIYTNIRSDITSISGAFIGNCAGIFGGAIYNQYTTIKDIKADFIGNIATYYGGAIFNINGNINRIEGTFIGNEVGGYGGAIFNQNSTIGSIVNSSFYNNYGAGGGGAIYTDTGLKIIANNYQSVFSGNYTYYTGYNNAIYVDNPSATLSFEMKNSGSFVLNDNIDGEAGYVVDIQGDNINDTTFYLLNDIIDANVNIKETTINTINRDIHVYDTFNSLTLNGNANFAGDVDLENKVMDRFEVGTYNINGHTLNVIGMNLLNDIPEDRTEITAVYFAEPSLKNSVRGIGYQETTELPIAKYQILTPIYKYNVYYDTENEYDGKGDGGYYVFTKGDKIIVPPPPIDPDPTDPTEPEPTNPDPTEPTPPPGGGGVTVKPTGNPSDAFNPAVLSGPVAAQIGGVIGMTTAYEYAFNHMDLRMMFSKNRRMSELNRNKYALATTNGASQYTYNEASSNGTWFRPYGMYDSIALKHGPKVKNFSFGTFFGGDGEMVSAKNGWSRVLSSYISYMGNHLSYLGQSTYQNGATVGITETLYKNNFFTGVTIAAGANISEAHTMYGYEDFPMVMAGIASKTGYNLEFKDGNFIIQPSIMFSYTFANTFAYTNAAKVRIKSSPLNTVQVSPTIRFIKTTKNHWKPYATIGMRWNLMNSAEFTANNIDLPEMSVKPYIEYGLGVHKHFKDKFCGMAQITLRNGGRNGVAAFAGFKYVLNNDNKQYKKFQPTTEDKEKTIIKQLKTI